MSAYRRNAGDGLASLFGGRRINRGAAWGLMIIGALLAFEIFNFSTTQFALLDMLGNLTFAGMRWATILAIAFCGIDFAGIARIFTPEQGADEPKEVWYLFGAWFLAATTMVHSPALLSIVPLCRSSWPRSGRVASTLCWFTKSTG